MGFFQNAPTLAYPILLLIPLSLVVANVAGMGAGRAVSGFGTLAILVVNLVYIVFFHSKKRWPNKTVGQRLWTLFTFGK